MMRVNVFGVQVSAINFRGALEFLASFNYNNNGYVCLPDLSVVIASQKDSKLLSILNNSTLTLPDGKPLEIVCRLKGRKHVSTVSGYWLVKELLKTDLKHYFYGSNEKDLKVLVDKITTESSRGKIVGYKSPPFIGIDQIEDNTTILQDIEAINNVKPDIVWVGISSPKQDYLMYNYHQALSHGIMIGVGGVFDYLAEKKKISPEWVKKIGLRWLYRFVQEPKRLWSKYALTFLGFFSLIIKSIGRK